MENKASSLSVNKLNKFYGTVQAVKDFSINVKPGEFLVLFWNELRLYKFKS